jgi:hypothetical protein
MDNFNNTNNFEKNIKTYETENEIKKKWKILTKN